MAGAHARHRGTATATTRPRRGYHGHPQSRGVRRAGMAEVKAELVGNLWKVVTEVGQQVEEDDTLMILESMKMEIPITSPITGTVKEILVREGEVVQEGQTVAVVE
ncbi:MAG TPA: biotin/lipoyl-binding carrier protein [Candidatus Dormibacteraeota bacterium]